MTFKTGLLLGLVLDHRGPAPLPDVRDREGNVAQLRPPCQGNFCGPVVNLIRHFTIVIYDSSVIFLQNNLFKFKNGTQKSTKTNHYIFLTNVSIKRCIIPSSNHVLLGGDDSSVILTTNLPILRL